MKQKVVKGLLWKLLENGGAQGVQFVIAIILARLLTPAQYGVVGIITIFITIANVVVQSGFSTALVQKQKADKVDFSSVCYFDLFVALVMYGILYAAAPVIASFYGIAELEAIVRVLSIVLFPGAVISVQTAYVSRNLEFKGLFLSTLAASVASGVISIWMAANGFGVWAMVGQQVSYYFVLMIALFFEVSWKPGLLFAFDRIKEMFSFGWKLLVASLIDTLFNNLYGLIMGKIYNEELLGAYNRGDQFPKLIVNNLGGGDPVSTASSLFLPDRGTASMISASYGAESHPVKLIFSASDAVWTDGSGRYPRTGTFGRAVADLRAVSADHVRGLFLLAYPHHEPAGHQRRGKKRCVFETGSDQKRHRD